MTSSNIVAIGQPATSRPYPSYEGPSHAADAREHPFNDLPWPLDVSANEEWLIHGLIPKHSLTLLSGASNVGKTWFSYALGLAVANGKDFIGLRVEKATPVLCVDAENPLVVIQRRLRRLGITEQPALWRGYGTWTNRPLPQPDDTDVIAYAESQHPLIIWDTLIAFNHGDEQSAIETRELMDKFRRLVTAGATVVILHHTGKARAAQRYRGSTDFMGSVDLAYCVEAGKKGHQKLERLRIECFKNRFDVMKNHTVDFIDNVGFAMSEIQIDARMDVGETLEQLISDNPGCNQSQLTKMAGDIGLAKNKVQRYLKERDPRMTKSGERNKLLYFSQNVDREEPPAGGALAGEAS